MSWLTKHSTPFIGEPKRLFHGAYHKMGTVWLMRVLEKVSETFKLTFQKCNQTTDTVNDDTDFAFANHSQLELSTLGEFAGSHMIRDPRDAIVSGYFYHLWTNESWARVAQDELGGQSFQALLNSLNQSDGITAEIDRFATYANDYGLREWDYENPRILELKYEDLIANEVAGFQRIFTHYGFSEKAIGSAIRIAKEFSFERIAKRSVGDTHHQNHLRSGQPRQWINTLSARHRAEIKAQIGDLLILMGYEDDLDW